MHPSDGRIGILGGTFNPVHHGHLLLARDVREQLELDRVLLIPNARSPLREGEVLAPADLRLSMVCAAVEGEEALGVHDVEVLRGGHSYTVETLEALCREHPGIRWYFLVGADSLETLERWHRVHDLLRLADVVVMPRPGYPLEASRRALHVRDAGVEEQLKYLAGLRHVDIRATEIRARVAARKSIRYLVPPAVEQIIQKHHLYQSPIPRA